MSKSGLHCQEIMFSTVRILNDPQADILITESLIFSCGCVSIIIIVVIVRIVWVSPGRRILVDRVIIFDLISAFVSSIPAVILICLLATGTIALCSVNQLGRPTACVYQEEHDCGKCQTLIFGRKYGCVPGPVVGEEEDEVIRPQYWFGRPFSSQAEVFGQDGVEVLCWSS